MATDSWRRAEKARDNFAVAALLLLAVAVVVFVLAMIIAVALDAHGIATAFSEVAFGSAVLSGVAYVMFRLIPDRTPPEEVERRARADRDAKLTERLASYQRIMSGEDGEQTSGARMWALGWEKELDARLALAKSPNTREVTLRNLARDESLDVRQAAEETLGSSQFKERQAAVFRAKQEKDRRNAEAKRQMEAADERRAVEERLAAQRRLREARSTDTPQNDLRFLATSDPSPEVRRAAIETLALLRQAGF